MSGFQHDIAGGQGNLIATSVQSPNYVPGVSGWQVKKDGSAEFNNLTIRGTFAAPDFIINSTGEYFYSGAPALNNLSISVVPGSAPVLDPEGNTAQGGVTVYGAGEFPFAQLLAGVLSFMAASGQAAPGIVGTFGVAGQCGVSSGKVTGADNPANMIALSSAASGTGQSEISLQAATTVVTGSLSVNGSTSTGAGDNGGVTSGPSGTVNAFPAAGPNHTHAEFHHHPL